MKIFPNKPHRDPALFLKSQLAPLGAATAFGTAYFFLLKQLIAKNLSDTQSSYQSSILTSYWTASAASIVVGLGAFYLTSKIIDVCSTRLPLKKNNDLLLKLKPKLERTPRPIKEPTPPLALDQASHLLPDLEHDEKCALEGEVPIEERFDEFQNIYGQDPFSLHDIISTKQLNGLITDSSEKQLMNILFTPYSKKKEESLNELLKTAPKLLSLKIKIPETNSFVLTPLIAAILNNQVEYLTTILRFTKNINQKDSHKYTSAHYAAMTANPLILRLLSDNGANFHLKNKFGATAKDMLEVQKEGLEKRENFFVYPFKMGPGFNKKFYLQRFKCEYLPSSIFSTSGLLAIRFYGVLNSITPESLLKHIKHQLKKLQKANQEVPKIYIKNLESKDNGSSLSTFLEGQLEARAHLDIAAGEVIGEYTGYHTHPKTNKKYINDVKTLGNVFNGYFQAGPGGNLLSYINHGPPNAFPIDVLYRGVPHQVLVALRPIKKDEPIHFDYSRNYFDVAGFEPEELAPKALQLFIEETENLTKFPHFYLKDGKSLSIFCNDNGEYTHTETPVRHDQSIEFILKAMYQKQMINYLIHFGNCQDQELKKLLKFLDYTTNVLKIK